ncbi:MAG: hypothetical protein B6I28_02810 [Fusobacteriia bacterium 4572_132]|nr:MAG: hypothetical protein B6I28_02810 [Fusobacteriia bacterium 4572_132]
MKKILLMLIVINLIGCTSGEIKDIKGINKIKERGKFKTGEEASLIKILRDQNNSNELRVMALDIIEKYNQENTKILLEELLPKEKNIKVELLERSLKFNNFNYPEECRSEILYYLLEKEKYVKFFNLYKEEKIKLNKEQLEKVYLKFRNNKNRKKLFKLMRDSDNYEMFKRSLNENFNETFAYFNKNYKYWIIKAAKGDEQLLLLLLNNINRKNYNEYKSLLYSEISSGTINLKEKIAMIIIENEENIEKFLLSKNKYLQRYAINKLGVKKAIEYYKKIPKKDISLYRALILLNDKSIESEVLKKYKETKQIKYLMLLYELELDIENTVLNKEILKLSLEEKKEFVKIYLEENLEKILGTLNFILPKEKNIEARIFYVNTILKYQRNDFLKLFRMIMKNEKFTSEEQKNILSKLYLMGDKGTQEQIMKTFENKIYNLSELEEKKIFSFSKKIKLWEEYLKKIPTTMYRKEIQNKLNKYDEALNEILKETKDIETKNFFEEKIASLEKDMYSNKSNQKKRVIQNKIDRLKIEMEKYIKKQNLNLKEKILQNYQNYQKIIDKINSLNQQLYQISEEEESKERIIRIKNKIKKWQIEKGKTAEIVKILYSEYLANIDDQKIKLDLETLKEIEEIE